MNPADLPSRGCSFEQLPRSKWWEGLSWLYLSKEKWPQTEELPDEEIVRRVLGRSSLNYEELNTILCDCEQIINSRPITYVSEDNRDPTPLTPMMFLQELPSSGIPDIDSVDSKLLSRRAKYRQRIRDNLRNRFRSEYLG
ncbi:uncharacterized protein NPIL_541191 [Nephila pilipes]|uniref:Uncharacterized protein n=1 Tax=Nephila pilipes TaxID=299642 RepID=A0A8X6PTM0_NEPPI|nr:uncharacterized protein NPIL_541191 [Nephila pilipes]